MLKSTREAISRQNRHMRANGYSRRKCPGSHTAGIPITGSWTYTHYCSVCKATFHVDAAGNVPRHMFWYKSTEADSSTVTQEGNMMKRRNLAVGDLVVFNHLLDAAVFRIVEIDGFNLRVIDRSLEGRDVVATTQWIDKSLALPLSNGQLAALK